MSLLGLLGSVGASIISNKGAKRRQQQADAQNIKFWQMQNAYNTPKQQMQRLKDAGLNPALIYGTSANTGVAGSVAPSRPAPYNIKDPVPSTLQSAMLTSQIRLQDSQSKKNNAEASRILGITPSEVAIATEQQAQEALRTLELQDSYKKRIAILVEKVKQEKSNTNVRNLDSDLAKQGQRTNDWLGWRKLGDIWSWATGEPADNWIKNNMPKNKYFINKFKETYGTIKRKGEDLFKNIGNSLNQ